MNRKLVISFNTDDNRRFTLNLNNPKEDLTEADVQAEAQKIIDSDSLTPIQGKPISVHSAKVVEQHVQNLI